MGKVLKTLILFSAPSLIRDRKLGSRHYRHCLVGTEMIDWLLQQSPEVHSRAQAIAMWQVLVDDSILVPGKPFFFHFQIQWHRDIRNVNVVPMKSTIAAATHYPLRNSISFHFMDKMRPLSGHKETVGA